jgi:hypothetical protein
MKQKEFTCCICGAVGKGYGHNPDPLKREGRCCEYCNATGVIPARIGMLGIIPNEEGFGYGKFTK